MNKDCSAKKTSPHSSHGQGIIHCVRPKSPLCVVAIHGGRMEPGTTEIANGIAGTEFSLYSFVSRKKSDRHIPSRHFVEPNGLAHAHASVVSIHGLKDEGNAFDIYVGGLDQELKTQIIDALTTAGFSAIEDRTRKHSGREKRNICNRGSSGKGVQLEITNRLRERLFLDLNRKKGREETRPLFAHLVRTIRSVLLN